MQEITIQPVNLTGGFDTSFFPIANFRSVIQQITKLL